MLSKQKRPNEKALTYALYGLIIGAGIGSIISILISYSLACYKYNLSLYVGLEIFGFPMIGMGIALFGFWGAIFGAIASLFSTNWNDHKYINANNGDV